MEIVIIALGLIIGSFLNVVIYRLPKEESFFISRSYCPNCQHKLEVIDLIPVVSFLLTGGKCRYCNFKIAVQYPLVEILTAFLALLIYFQFGFSQYFWIYSYLVSLLIVSSFIDLNHHIIPNKITYPNIIIGLLLSLFLDHITFISSISGIIFPATFLFLIAYFYKGSMGMGDIKLIAMIGSFIGAKYAFFGIFIASFIGTIIGLGLIILKRKGMKSRIAFGPFLALGSLIMILWGTNIIGLIFRVNDFIYGFLT